MPLHPSKGACCGVAGHDPGGVGRMVRQLALHGWNEELVQTGDGIRRYAVNGPPVPKCRPPIEPDGRQWQRTAVSAGEIAMNSRPPSIACLAFLLGICPQTPAAPAADDAQADPVQAADIAELACRARPVQPQGRPRVGIALGGGGARGIAHISVLRKLEELHVPIDCIAGTSMGALVGALYASGMSVDEIEKTVLTLDWPSLFNDSLERPERTYRRKRDDELVVATPGIGIGKGGAKLAPGVLAGERILLLFAKLIEPVSAIEDFDRLPIPYRAVAADINNGEPVIIGNGDLAMAMRASMSIPGAFPPVQIGDRVLVDGGVARNIPVDVVRNMGADIVVAVDVGTPLATMTPQTGVLGLAEQITGLLTVRNTHQQLATLTERDILISPPLGSRVATSAFSKGREALAIGKEGADAASGQLARLSLSADAYDQNVSIRTGRQIAAPIIQFVRLDNRTRYRDELLLAGADIPLGEPLDSDRLAGRLHRIYGVNTLSLATYEVVEEDGKTGVVLHFQEKSQGPNYLEVGVTMSNDFNGAFDFSVRLGLLQSPINDLGGELRYLVQLGDDTGLLIEYYQPFGTLSRYFFFTRAQYRTFQISTFDDNSHKTAEYYTRQAGIVAGVGREFGNYGAVTLGGRRFTGEAEVQIGDPGLPDFDFEVGDVTVEVSIDRLDSFFFPRDGYAARAGYTFSRDAFGADTDFDQFDFDGLAARSFGKHSALFGLRYHTTTAGIAPVQSLYRIGGFSRLVGFQLNELSGQHYGVVAGWLFLSDRQCAQSASAVGHAARVRQCLAGRIRHRLRRRHPQWQHLLRHGFVDRSDTVRLWWA